jgi:hypothetical protein
VLYWSTDADSYVAESAMMPNVAIGLGATPDEAKQSFDAALNDVFDELTADNVAGYKMGRPAKGYVPLNTNIRPASKQMLAELARQMDISQGEVVDYLLFFHKCKLEEEQASQQMKSKSSLAITSQGDEPAAPVLLPEAHLNQ